MEWHECNFENEDLCGWQVFPAPPGKVENVLKGSLDSIPSPSPSVKIQIMGEKVCLR